MKRWSLVATLCLAAAALALAPGEPLAQQAKKAAVKAGKGEKVCRVKMIPSGERRSWICKSEEPCCVWHEINYTKCGSVTFGCL
jgi:hypothetical protein